MLNSLNSVDASSNKNSDNSIESTLPKAININKFDYSTVWIPLELTTVHRIQVASCKKYDHTAALTPSSNTSGNSTAQAP